MHTHVKVIIPNKQFHAYELVSKYHTYIKVFTFLIFSNRNGHMVVTDTPLHS